MSTLTKAELIARLEGKLGISVQQIKVIVEQTFEEMRIALEQGEQVMLSGFGAFNVRNKSPRPGCNPRTGEAVTVSARRVVTFKIGATFKKLLKEINKFEGD